MSADAIARGLTAKARVAARRQAVLQRLVDRATRAAASNPLDLGVYAAETVTMTETSGAGSLPRFFGAVAQAAVFDVSGGLPIAGLYTDGTTQFVRFGSARTASTDNIGSAAVAPFTSTPPYRSNGWRVRFWTDAPVVNIRIVGNAAGSYRALVNGQYVSKTPTSMGGNTARFVQLSFGAFGENTSGINRRDRRRIARPG